MIFTKEDEKLFGIYDGQRYQGTAKVPQFEELIENATKRHESLRDINIDDSFNAPLGVIYNPATGDVSLKYSHPYLKDGSKEQKGYHVCDGTEYAYKQVCNLLGIPSDYLDSLYARGLTQVAADTVRALSQDSRRRGRFEGQRVLRFGDRVEAVVSKKYDNNFPTCNILEVVKDTIDLNRWVPNQAFISNSRFHMRMVDFDNPVTINGDRNFIGITIDNSDIGKSALNLRVYWYRYACKNGLVVAGKGGVLYRQVHLGKAFDADAISEFKCALTSDIDYLRTLGAKQIEDAQKRMMSLQEMRAILENKSYGLRNDDIDNIISIATTQYAPTKWGLINGITENAKIYSLTDRIAQESVAGQLLAKAM